MIAWTFGHGADTRAGQVHGFTGDLTIDGGGGGVSVTLGNLDVPGGNVTTDVIPGQTYTFTATIAPTGRAMHIYVQWYEAGPGALLGSFSGNTIAAGSSGVSTFTGVAPANAGYVRFYAAYGASGNNGDTVTVTKVGWWKGTGGTWAMPGQPILGLTDAPIGNLLTLNQATGASTSGIGVGGTTLARVSDSLGYDGYAIEVTKAGAGNGYVVIGGASDYIAAPYTIPCRPGEIVSATVDVWSPSDTQTVTLKFRFKDSSGGSIVTYDKATTLSTSVQTLKNTITAPANTAYVMAYVEKVQAGSGSESFRYSRASIHRGAAGVWSAPGTPVVGQSHIATNGAVHLSGTGSPEGVVTAAPGSTWLQTDATTDVKGWIRWVKATGTGNTGWVAGPEADTGWRLVSSWDTAGTVTGAAFGTGWEPRTGVAGQFLVRRRGAAIDLVVSQIQTNASSPSAAIFASLTGFTPTYTAVAAVSAAATCPLEFTGSGLKRAGSQSIASGVAAYSISVTASTAVAWPASLPGSAA